MSWPATVDVGHGHAQWVGHQEVDVWPENGNDWRRWMEEMEQWSGNATVFLGLLWKSIVSLRRHGERWSRFGKGKGGETGRDSIGGGSSQGGSDHSITQDHRIIRNRRSDHIITSTPSSGPEDRNQKTNFQKCEILVIMRTNIFLPYCVYNKCSHSVVKFYLTSSNTTTTVLLLYCHYDSNREKRREKKHFCVIRFWRFHIVRNCENRIQNVISS